MRNIILYLIYSMFIGLVFTSSAYAFSSADFGDDSFDASSGSYERLSSNNDYDGDVMPQRERLAYDSQVDSHQYYASNQSYGKKKRSHHKKTHSSASYASRLPQTSGYGEKVIIINPRKHVWGAYSADGKLLRAGLATAGASWCPDIHRACRTRSGTFRINSLGSRSCYSKRYPVGRGGAPMPYCMFFNGNQGLHGSNQLAEANLSHGCVRISVSDAEWVRFNFATIGTKVVVTSY